MAGRKRNILATLRLLLAALAVAAVARQLVHGWERPAFDVANFFSFFTIESNLLATVVLAIAGVTALRGGDGGTRLDLMRGAATLYMATTGIVYSVMLSGTDSANDPLLPWVNTVLHDVMPLAVVADWLIDPPRRRIELRQMLTWLGFPLAFIVYTLIRGELIGWYPYPFVDVAAKGYLEVAITSIVIGAGMLAFGWLLVWAAALRSR